MPKKKAAKKPSKPVRKPTKQKPASKLKPVAKPVSDKAVPEAPAPVPTEPSPAPLKKEPRRRTAQDMAASQREISVAEFFTKNRHLLGFDNPRKALLTTVKEAVDNALDACEEAGIIPEVIVEIREIPNAKERYTVIVEDNGPGIVRAQIPKIFGKLLYGSKFHRLKQSRGQQGIGISAAAMYGQLTTGASCRITSKTGAKRPAHYFEIHIDAKKNMPVVHKDEEIKWERLDAAHAGSQGVSKAHGTRVEIDLEGIFHRGKRSVDEYLEQVLVANPHVTIRYKSPENANEWPRATNTAPPEAVAIKPHPYGVELGILIQMLKGTKARNIRGFLMSEFSRVGPTVADEIIGGAKLDSSSSPKHLSTPQADALYRSIQATKIQRPPTNCLSPIGEELMLEGLKRVVPGAEFTTSISRPPAVYRGNPFCIEAALSWGGEGRSLEDGAELIRFANRVPLQYQQAACSVTKGVTSTNWRAYGLQQPGGALPIGPLVIAIHIASAWVPFTSESKEAIASYPEILKEMKLALQECGRRLGLYLGKKARIADAEKKKSYIKTYIPQLAEALKVILALSDTQTKKVVTNLTDVLERSRTIE